MAAHLYSGTMPASCVTSTGILAQNAATILKLLMFCSIPTQSFLHMLLTSHVVSIPLLLP